MKNFKKTILIIIALFVLIAAFSAGIHYEKTTKPKKQAELIIEHFKDVKECVIIIKEHKAYAYVKLYTNSDSSEYSYYAKKLKYNVEDTIYKSKINGVYEVEAVMN